MCSVIPSDMGKCRVLVHRRYSTGDVEPGLESRLHNRHSGRVLVLSCGPYIKKVIRLNLHFLVEEMERLVVLLSDKKELGCRQPNCRTL